MSSAPDIDPYAVLGVQKDATLTEIKSAHRKLVLKCHPDKIKDESQRSQAQDEFQRVQQAYETLSDETKRIKYDQKVRLAELRREMMARGGPARSSGTSREYRDGRIYEERVPADAAFFDEHARFTEEPRPMSRKHDDYGRRQRSKTTDEKKSRTVPVDHLRAAKESIRENVKATHSDRDKYRTKERRREKYEKFERAGSYYGTDNNNDDDDDDDDDGGGGGASDSSASSIYVRVKRPSESRRSRESTSRKTKSTDSSRRSERSRYEEDGYSDAFEGKHEKWHDAAQYYISRSRAVPGESERRHRSPRSPTRQHVYESVEPESTSSRRPARSTRSSREDVRPSASRNNSYEHLESQPRVYEIKRPSMPTAATSPGIKVSSTTVRPSLQTSRSASSAHTHSRSKASVRLAESILQSMVRPSKPRGVERYDSGYSSPGTPEMAPGDSPTKTSMRYKVKDQIDTVVVEPVLPSPTSSSSRHSRAYSPPRTERAPKSSRSKPKPTRSNTTYAYPVAPESSSSSSSSSRYESARVSAPRHSPPLFGEPEYNSRSKDKDYPRDAYPRHYDQYREPPVGRRQSTFA
ncbi:J domain-containing protein [Aspergillus clavatus NRRL 1]|uniref:DnaJ domain protein n=1 Tax=Aspergillus clavatus (strain ATCC 1007 / CBS 513.65 / DSM 816 / NCTC 3887 / NRRL 1 / QM 1276 / 107) TaxID=344612 RepID=A1CR63_ASPCL|nr:DnaJ domain protein [Aspergillus clavatus NRRL 1]EAW08134.1 DnaJ domain protein [Aspergillus clavatus NRRL 1]